MNRTYLVPSADPPDLIVEAHDPLFGKIGYVIIDRPVQGAACGGVRYATDTLEGLCDIARSMTFKWGWLNVPMGGAKGWITADVDALGCDRRELMRAYGRAIRPLVQRGVYLPGVDLGTTNQDLSDMLGAAGTPLSGEQIDASLATSLTVFESLRAAAAFQGKDLQGLRIALEGFGKVAAGLAPMLAEAGARLVAVSTAEGAVVAENGLDVPRLLDLKRQHGDSLVAHYSGAQRLPRAELLCRPVDVLVPGALSHTIHSGNVDLIRAEAIVPIANAPVSHPAEQALLERGVLLLPDFVANCGGVFAVDANGQHFHLDEVQTVIQSSFARSVARLLQAAQTAGQPAVALARQIAWNNHVELNQSASGEGGGLRGLPKVWREQGAAGVRRRLAWRAYSRLRNNAAIRATALERYDEFRLGVTLRKLAEVAA